MTGRKSHRMRVLLLCFWAHSNCYYTAKFSNSLADHGIETHLAVPENFMFDLLSEKVMIEVLPFRAPARVTASDILKLPFQVLFQTLNLVLMILRIRPDWTHVLWKHHVPLLLIPLIKRKNLAYTAHDPVLHSGEKGILPGFVNKIFIKFSDVCFVHGKKNVDVLKTRYAVPPEKICNIPHGELMFWGKLPPVLPENRVLFFGRIRKYKGIDVLIEAFEKVNREVPELQLLVCGEGNLGDCGAKIKKLKTVRVINRFIEHREISDLFLGSQFLILPYLEASQSGVIPMAFALGRTCIATEVGAIPEIIKDGENGILVKPGDAEELAKAIIFLYRNKQTLNELEGNALKSVATLTALSWDRTADSAIKAYFSCKKKRCK